MASAYIAACKAANCRVVGAVTASFEGAVSYPELNLAGNRVVELLDKRLQDLDVAPITVALQDSNPFRAIDMSYNRLGAGAAESLRQLIASDTTISRLDLSENDMTESAAQSLAAGLVSNTAILELHLSGNHLRSAGGIAMADVLQNNRTLKKLYLRNCELNVASLVAIATVLRDNVTLEVLDVSRPLGEGLMDEHAQHFARMLKVNTGLKELRLAHAGISDFGLYIASRDPNRTPARCRCTAPCGPVSPGL